VAARRRRDCPTPTSPATSPPRSTPRTSTTSKSSAAATPPTSATAPTASSTSSRAPASSATARPSSFSPPATSSRPTTSSASATTLKLRLVRQPQRQPQRLRPRPAHRPRSTTTPPTARAASLPALQPHAQGPAPPHRQLRARLLPDSLRPQLHRLRGPAVQLQRPARHPARDRRRCPLLLAAHLNPLHRPPALALLPLQHRRLRLQPQRHAHATTVHRASNYAGAQASLTTTVARNTLQAGLYSFGQHDSYLFGVLFNDGSGTAPIHENDATAGGVVEEYVSDNYKPTSWLTLIAGLRQTHFQGQFTEDYTDPRVGAALLIPRLNWVFRAFYGRFYQPPPLLTASGPVLAFANANTPPSCRCTASATRSTSSALQIPYRGWLLDADTFKNRVNNFLDHSNIGDSSIYFPITVDGALVRAWELTLRSPRIARLGQAHLAYSNQIAEQRGNITGGLICTPIGDPACDAGFATRPSTTISATPSTSASTPPCPRHAYASTNVYYGSGFTNGAYHLRRLRRKESRRELQACRYGGQRHQPSPADRQFAYHRRLPLQRSPAGFGGAALPLPLLRNLRTGRWRGAGIRPGAEEAAERLGLFAARLRSCFDTIYRLKAILQKALKFELKSGCLRLYGRRLQGQCRLG
jgi:hypothetical protein